MPPDEAKTALPFPSVGSQAKKARRPGAAHRKRPGLEDLDRVARRLEADWQLALRKHEGAVHERFLDLRDLVHRGKPVRGKTAAALRKALEPRLKPKKGRAKDLRRVESALDDALARLR